MPHPQFPEVALVAEAPAATPAPTIFVRHASDASPFGPRTDPCRRRLLGLGLFVGTCALTHTAAAAVLQPTPPMTAGPFRPRTPPAEVDADLGQLEGHARRALGIPFVLDLLVLDAHGAPVAGAGIDLWQANARGRYAHPGDSDASGPLDADFQGYAQLRTDAAGRLRVRSVLPGAYGDGSFRRTPHLHLIVHAGDTRLVTQMFFPDQPLNAGDFLYGRLSPAARRAATARALPSADEDARLYGWDVVLPAG